MSKIKFFLPGVGLAVALALISFTLRDLTSLGSVMTAIVLGALIRLVVRLPAASEKGLKFCESRILELAICFFGLQMNMNSFGTLSLGSIVSLLLLMMLFIALMPRVTILLGLDKKYGVLLGAGTAICGSAAIGAISKILQTRREDTLMAMAVINLAGLIAMFILPAFANSFSVESLAIIIGGGLPAVGHVVGAGYSISSNVGLSSVSIKLLRILFLIPVVLYFSLNNEKQKFSFKTIPWFVPAFAIMATIRNFELLPVTLINFANGAGDFLLVISMAAMGLQINFDQVRRYGAKSLSLGIVTVALFILIVCGISLF